MLALSRTQPRDVVTHKESGGIMSPHSGTSHHTPGEKDHEWEDPRGGNERVVTNHCNFQWQFPAILADLNELDPKNCRIN